MEYIPSADYDYIINKYHDTAKPFNRFARFLCNDALFDPATGLSAEEIRQGILDNDQQYLKRTHAERKAHAFAFVLQNTRIACSPHDRFPAIHAIDRPLNATLVAQWRAEVFQDIIPEISQRMSRMEKEGIVTIWPDFDHSVPVWDRVLGRGFSGLLSDAREAREKLMAQRELNAREKGFFEGVFITYEAICRFVGRLASQARRDGNARLAQALDHLKESAPSTFYEALVTIYLYFMLSEHIEGLQVRSLSNFDRLCGPYFEADLAHGVSEEELRTDLAYFFLQFTAIDNYWNQPVYLGGTKANGETEINHFSYVFLDVYDKMGIYNPKIQIKLAKNTPEAFVLKALDMIRRGHNSIVFVTEEVITAALMRRGLTAEQARTCDIKGCYEYSPQSAMGTGMNYVNMMKPLEYTLYGGRDGVTGKLNGLQTPTDFDSFDDFYAAYKKQLFHLVDIIIETVNGFENYLAFINPQSMLGGTYPTCLEKARDPLQGGGVTNGSGIAFGFIANVVDSLTVIRRMVFDRKELTLAQLGEILKNNFEGQETLRRRIRRDGERFGNNKPFPDGLARDLTQELANYVNGTPNASERGGRWGVSFHVARMSYTQGALTAASADGRLRGEELSKNASASLGNSRSGATAAILSTTKIDATLFTGDAALDLALHSSAAQGEEGLKAMYGLVRTFAERGGHAIHINVFSADVLRDAQAHPENYPDLQIRVCGWNVLFNQISPAEQEGFIRQAEAAS